MKQSSSLGNPVDNRASHWDGDKKGGVASFIYGMVYFKCSCYRQLEVSSSGYMSGDQEKDLG